MKHVFAAGVLSVVMIMTPVLAHATISFQLGNHPQPDEDLVGLTAGDVFGSIVLGVTVNGGVVVRFFRPPID